MKTEYLKTLWTLRFEKIKKCETEASEAYEQLAARSAVILGADHPAVQMLRQLVQEENVHARLAESLIRICHETHPECENLSTDWDH